jgi:hypothetical protein
VEPLRLIGYWRDDKQPQYPDPALFVDPTWDEDEREWVYAYLKYGVYVRGYLGYAPCRLCDKRDNGAAEISGTERSCGPKGSGTTLPSTRYGYLPSSLSTRTGRWSDSNLSTSISPGGWRAPPGRHESG